MGLGFGLFGEKVSPLSILFGVNDVWMEHVDEVAAGAGNFDIAFETVPDGEIWVATNINILGISGSMTFLQMLVNDDGTLAVIRSQGTPTTTFTYTWSVFIVIGSGDNLQARMSNATAGNRIIAGVIGFKMKT